MEQLIAQAVHLLLALGGAYYLALWFALVVWTFQDIQTRTRSVIAQIFATLLVVLFSVPGVVLYLLMRPRETLEEQYERALEEEYLIQDLEATDRCPSCRRPVQEEFQFCPYCRTALKQLCVSCGRLLSLDWPHCPYCGAAQPSEEPEFVVRERRSPLEAVQRALGRTVPLREHRTESSLPEEPASTLPPGWSRSEARAEPETDQLPRA
ncbi:zinc ribbon domain-containing protein [Thermomicrobium sp. CFH 73360]|uniref:double zinc ribbon domain-containing protein n=1 Tax=Thermomicrobium sp. CFH 73360 TaxID=2951987 RepID=UPI002077252B|nr:zinc ribbon domain-containing protein [Thermomicrobium sp. CFH 73360]